MFWTRFINLCAKIGEAPNTVAAKCGVKSTGTVSGWKNGAMPRYSILLKLSEYFGVSYEYLIGAENEYKPAPVTGNELDIESIIDSMSREQLVDLIMAASARLREIE